MLSSEIVPIMELLTSMKKHSVPEEVDVSILTFLRGFYAFFSQREFRVDRKG